MKLLILFAFLVTSPASADQGISDFAHIVNKFDFLKAHYDRAPLPASLGDFDEYGSPSNQKCVISWEGKDNLEEISIRRYVKDIPGDPNYGPLFPGTPDRKETILLVGDVSPKVASYFHTEATTTDFIVRTNDSIDLIGAPWKFYLRKNGDLIHMLAYVFYGKPNQVAVAGYCWRE